MIKVWLLGRRGWVLLPKDSILTADKYVFDSVHEAVSYWNDVYNRTGHKTIYDFRLSYVTNDKVDPFGKIIFTGQFVRVKKKTKTRKQYYQLMESIYSDEIKEIEGGLE